MRELIDDTLTRPPYPIDSSALLIAYYASAEWSCHLAMGWPVPLRIMDLYAEFSCITSGIRPPHGRSLLGALSYYGLPAIDAVEKSEMRDLAIRGGPFTLPEKEGLIDYCQTDVDALARLLPRMLPSIDVPRALLRGRYTAAVATMEQNGVPIDVNTLHRLRNNWDAV